MSKAVVFFAEGTEECEALLVVDLLRRAKVEVTVASASGSREILSSHKITTSYGLGGAIPFALELVRQLAGQAEADRIQNAIAYRH